jgi:hypothetical protein
MMHPLQHSTSSSRTSRPFELTAWIASTKFVRPSVATTSQSIRSSVMSAA